MNQEGNATAHPYPETTCDKPTGILGPRAFRETQERDLQFANVSKVDAPYLKVNEAFHTLDLSANGQHLAVSGNNLRILVIKLEDGEIKCNKTEETMCFDLKFDVSDDIWYVCNDHVFKRMDYKTKNITLTHKDEKGSQNTVKEVNNMIELNESKSNVYCRLTNTKIAEFSTAANTFIQDYDLAEGAESNNNENFLYYFKIAQGKILYTVNKSQHLKLYDMGTKSVIASKD